MVSGRQKQTFDARLAEAFDQDAIPRSTSLGEAIAASLRGHILMARLLPHAPISETAVAEAYGVGRAQVREALRLLEAEYLVRRVPQSGNYVCPISARLVREGGFLRLSVEEANVRDLATSLSDDQLHGLDRQIDAQREAARRSDQVLFHDLDEAFHAGLFEASERSLVWAFLQPAKLHVDRARIATLGLAASPERAIREHCRIIEALRARDPDAAVTAMRSHLQRIDVLMSELSSLEPTFVEHE